MTEWLRPNGVAAVDDRGAVTIDYAGYGSEHRNMNRRRLLSAAAFVLAAPTVALAEDAPFVDYTRQAYDAALASGEPFILGFLSTW